MLAALDHQNAIQTQQQARLEQEIVWQSDEQERIEGLLGSVTRDGDNMRKEIQTLSEQLTQTLKQVGELTTELGTTRRLVESSTGRTQPKPSFTFLPPHSNPMQMPSIPEEAKGSQVLPKQIPLTTALNTTGIVLEIEEDTTNWDE